MKTRLLIFVLIATLYSHAQTIVNQFAGDVGTFVGSVPTYKDHPDMSIGVNGTQILAVTGQDVQVYNYAGVLLNSVSTSTFVTNAGLMVGTVNDPRAVWDRFINRWIVACSCSNTYLIVSSGPDAVTSTWKGVALTSNSGDKTMNVRYDANWIFESEYNTTGCSGNAVTEIAIPQGDVAWSGGGNVSLAHEIVSTCHTYDAAPIFDYTVGKPTSGAGSAAYFVSRVGEAQNQTNAAISLAIDTFTPTSATTGSFSAAGSPTTISTGYLYNTPVDVVQPGSPGGVRSTESHRPFSAVTTNGTDFQIVWGSGPCTTSGTCNTEGVNSNQHFLWFDVAIPGLTLIQKAKISNGSVGYIFPALSVDGSNNTAMVATGCGSSQFCSLYSWYHLTSDAAGVIHGPNLVTPGTANYQVCTTTPHPGWGTYANMDQDPTDTTKMFAYGEFAGSSVVCQWQTQIIEMNLSTPSAPQGNYNNVTIGGTIH